MGLIVIIIFIIKKLAEQFKGHFTCLRENSENYITFTVPIEKAVWRLDKIEKKLQNIYFTYYSLLVAQGLWFPCSSALSNLVNNIFEGIHTVKCKFKQNDKKC